MTGLCQRFPASRVIEPPACQAEAQVDMQKASSPSRTTLQTGSGRKTKARAAFTGTQSMLTIKPCPQRGSGLSLLLCFADLRFLIIFEQGSVSILHPDPANLLSIPDKIPSSFKSRVCIQRWAQRSAFPASCAVASGWVISPLWTGEGEPQGLGSSLDQRLGLRGSQTGLCRRAHPKSYWGNSHSAYPCAHPSALSS